MMCSHLLRTKRVFYLSCLDTAVRCSRREKETGKVTAMFLEDHAWSLLFELLLEELLALDLVVLAELFAGQYQARPPVLSPVEGFFPLHTGFVPVLVLPKYLQSSGSYIDALFLEVVKSIELVVYPAIHVGVQIRLDVAVELRSFVSWKGWR